MPELPEVETVRTDLQQRLVRKKIRAMRIMCARLREPIDDALAGKIVGCTVRSVRRRAKYILVDFDRGSMVVHLGMSGSIRTDQSSAALRKHDHVEWLIKGATLRYNDPRRFGRIWWTDDPQTDSSLTRCGIEPLTRKFSAAVLHDLTRNRSTPIKSLLMDGSKIAGIGNIYACESLFRAGIRPAAAASKLSMAHCVRIVRAIKHILNSAIRAGGSTLRDHAYGDEQIGYFQQQHKVYGRASLACRICGKAIKRIMIAQRSTFFCPACQSNP